MVLERLACPGRTLKVTGQSLLHTLRVQDDNNASTKLTERIVLIVVQRVTTGSSFTGY